MPLKDCVLGGDNKLYCWNDETGEIDVYVRSSQRVEKCPPDVVARLMHLLSQKNRDGRENG